MMEAGFEDWSETEVNHKGQGGDPRLVTEGAIRYLGMKEAR